MSYYYNHSKHAEYIIQDLKHNFALNTCLLIIILDIKWDSLTQWQQNLNKLFVLYIMYTGLSIHTKNLLKNVKYY